MKRSVKTKRAPVEQAKGSPSKRTEAQRKNQPTEQIPESVADSLELSALQAIVLDITAERDLSALLHTLVERATRLLNATSGGLYLVDPDRQAVRCVVSYNTPHDYTDTVLKYGEGAAGIVAQTGQPLLIDDYRAWSSHVAVFEADQPFTSMLSVPLIWQGNVTGVLHVLGSDEEIRHFTSAELNLLTRFAQHAAIAVENARRLAALRQSEERFRQLSTAAFEAIAIHDQGKLIDVNETYCRMLGVERSEVEGTSALEITAPESRESVLQHIRSGSEETYEAILMRKDGTRFTAELHGRPILYEDRVVRVTAIRDITERKQAEEALRQSEEKFRLLVENASEMFYQVSLLNNTLHGEVVFVSLQVQAITGHSAEEFLRDTELWVKSIHPDDRPSIFETTQTLLTQHIPVTREYRLWNAGRNDFRWVSDRATPRFDTRGKLIGYQGVARDITERKHAEDALRESEREYRRLISLLPSGVVVHSAGQILLANNASAKFFGAESPEQLIGSALIERVHPDHRNIVQSRIQQSMQKGTVAPLIQERLLRLDGTAFDAEVAAMPILYAGKPSTLAMFNDITERKQGEETLQQLAAIVDSSNDAIISTDLNDNITSWNSAAERLYGYSAAEVQGRSILIIVPTQQSSRISNYLVRFRRGEYIDPYETVRVRKDGRQVEVWVVLSPIKNSTGQIIGVSSVTRDITERKRLEQQIADESTFRQQVLSVAPVGIITYQPSGECISANEAAAQIVGATVEQLTAQNFRQIESWKQSGLLAVAEQTLTTGTPHQLEAHVFTTFGREVWLICNFVPFRIGNELHLMGVYIDITDRKRAEAALRESEDRYRTLAEAAHDMIFIVKRDGYLEYVNESAAQQFHLDKANVIGQRIGALFSPSDFNQQSTSLQNVFVSGQPLYAENQFIFPDRKVWLGTWLAPIKDAVGVVTSVLGISRDITERKQAEGSLQRRLNELSAIHRASQSLQQLRAPEALARDIIEMLEKTLQYEYSVVLLIDQSSGMLIPFALSDQKHGPDFAQYDKAYIEAHRVRLGVGITGWVAQHGESVLVGDVQHDPHYLAIRDNIHSELCVPLRIADRLIGVINIESTQPDAYTEADQRVLETIGAQIASAIENARLFAETHLRAQRQETLYHLSTILARTQSVQELCEAVTRAGKEILGYPFMGVFLVELVTGDRVLRAQTGWDDIPANWRLRPGEGISEQVLITGQLHYTPDVSREPRYVRTFRGVGCEIDVPIKAGDSILGVLVVENEQVDAFGPEDFNVLQAAANQLAVALENARLFEAELQQRVLAEALRDTAAALTKTLNFDELLDQILIYVGRVVPHDAANIMVNESGIIRIVRQRGYHRAGTTRALTRLGIPLVDARNLRVMAETGEPVIIPDTRAEPGWVRIPETDWIASTLGAPIQAKEQVIGFVSLDSATPGFFTPTHANHLRAFTDQVAVAMENTRLFNSERNQRRRLEILYWSGQAINSTLEVTAILDRLTDEALRATGATHGAVLIARRDLGYFERQSLRGYSPQLAEKAHTEKLLLDRGVNGRAYQTGRIVYMGDVQRDANYFPLISDTRSELVVPILHRDEVIGNLDLQSPDLDAFENADLSFLQALTDQVAVAIEKARLFEEIQQHADELEQRVAARTRELSEANERLQVLDKLKDQFIITVSHEFRTPLTTILSSTELLEHYGARLAEDRKIEYLRQIATAVQHMTSMLEDVLIIGKTDANKLNFDPRPLNLLTFCQDLVEAMQLSAGREHTLNLIGHIEYEMVNLDINLLHHILSNLLSNAVKYSPKGSSVEFEVTSKTDRVIFQITDHGIGIPPEDQTRIFETFHRAKNVGNIQGTGLGLAIVKRSVDLHGGTIEIASQVDVGTTVTVKLPTTHSSAEELL